MSKVRSLLYTLDIYNLQVKTVSFSDQGKWLNEENGS